MKLIVYLDLLSLINLIMNFLILWATAKLSNIKYSLWRLLLTALLGTIYTIMNIMPRFAFLNRISFHLLISVIMVIVSFAPLSRKLFFKTIGYFYLITFVAAGAIFALYNLTGGNPLDSLARVLNISPNNLWIIILGSLFVIVIGKFGWIFIQYKLLPDIFCVPIIISFDDKVIEMNALVDTGNQLQDPLTKVPVIVVELEEIMEILPDEVRRVISEYSINDGNLMSQFSDIPWSNRFRLIPFSSLGKSDGMLIGFRPDNVRIRTKNEIFIVDRVIVALQDKKLDPNNNYQALLNPEVFREEAVSSKG